LKPKAKTPAGCFETLNFVAAETASDGTWAMSFKFNFNTAKQQWKRVPVDNIAYLDPDQIRYMSDAEFLDLVRKFEFNRYGSHGWRNFKGKWREKLGLDTTTDKVVLDFGCGLGIESIQFAKKKNRVILADINQSSLDVATRGLKLFGATPLQTCLATGEYPYFTVEGQYDIFYSNGVLHHTPEMPAILKRATENLKDDGEVRLMLYSDKGWKLATGTAIPPVDQPVSTNHHFWQFVRFFDEVGMYADWYNREKLEHYLGSFLTVVSCDYITTDDRYLVAILKKK